MPASAAPGWDGQHSIKRPYELPQGPVHQDMDAPLSHYFISSGHNSYLTSDQWAGDSGTSTIVQSLQRGCRMIELDCYNGSSSKRPICKHGGTATKPIHFLDCIKAIKEHGFKASDWPVIITLENHTDHANQRTMVRMLKDVLGDELFWPPVQSQMQPQAPCQPPVQQAASSDQQLNMQATTQLGEEAASGPPGLHGGLGVIAAQSEGSTPVPQIVPGMPAVQAGSKLSGAPAGPGLNKAQPGSRVLEAQAALAAPAVQTAAPAVHAVAPAVQAAEPAAHSGMAVNGPLPGMRTPGLNTGIGVRQPQVGMHQANGLQTKSGATGAPMPLPPIPPAPPPAAPPPPPPVFPAQAGARLHGASGVGVHKAQNDLGLPGTPGAPSTPAASEAPKVKASLGLTRVHAGPGMPAVQAVTGPPSAQVPSEAPGAPATPGVSITRASPTPSETSGAQARMVAAASRSTDEVGLASASVSAASAYSLEMQPPAGVGADSLPGPIGQWLSPAALRGKFVIRSNLDHACDDLLRVVYIPNIRFRGLQVMNAAEHVTSSSINESKVVAMVKQACRTVYQSAPYSSGLQPRYGPGKRPALSAPAVVPVGTAADGAVGTGGGFSRSNTSVTSENNDGDSVACAGRASCDSGKGSSVACGGVECKGVVCAPAPHDEEAKSRIRLQGDEAGGAQLPQEPGGDLNELAEEAAEAGPGKGICEAEAEKQGGCKSRACAAGGPAGPAGIQSEGVCVGSTAEVGLMGQPNGHAQTQLRAVEAQAQAQAQLQAQAQAQASREQLQPQHPLPRKRSSPRPLPPQRVRWGMAPLRRMNGARYGSTGASCLPAALAGSGRHEHQQQAVGTGVEASALSGASVMQESGTVEDGRTEQSGDLDSAADDLCSSSTTTTTASVSSGSSSSSGGGRPSVVCKLKRTLVKAKKGGWRGVSVVMKGVWKSGAVQDAVGGGSSDNGYNGLGGCLHDALVYSNRHILRVFPAGWRLNSKNYNPSPAWAMGASCAALNWQKWDKPLWINQGKFMHNGNCGYVKKPDWMLNPDWDVNLGPPAHHANNLVVRIYAARMPTAKALHLRSSRGLAAVKLEVWGMPVDCGKWQMTTLVQRNGRMPMLQAEHGFQVMYPEMAVLLLTLGPKDSSRSSRVCGYFSLPLTSLQPGAYKLALLDRHGNQQGGDDCWIKVHMCWGARAMSEAGEPDSLWLTAWQGCPRKWLVRLG